MIHCWWFIYIDDELFLRSVGYKLFSIDACIQSMYCNSATLNTLKYVNNIVHEPNGYILLLCAIRGLGLLVVRNCGLEESARACDKPGCEFESWPCRINILLSHVHRAYDYYGPFGVLWLWYKYCLKTKLGEHIQYWFQGEWTKKRNSTPRRLD